MDIPIKNEETMLAALKGIVVALTQRKVHPADIALAIRFARMAIGDVEGHVPTSLREVAEAMEPTSSACKRESWCNRQVGHSGDCLPQMMADGSF